MSLVPTPGPWRVSDKAGDAVISMPASVRPSAFNSDYHMKYYGGFLIAESISPENRALIASAPELLAALKNLHNTVRTLDCDRSGWNEMDDAEAAIAKAEGKA